MIPIILKNYDLDKIIFKKPEKISDKITIFNIKYNDHDFLIQTPKFFIPDIPTIYCHQNRNFCNLKIVAHNYKFENNTKNFVKKISELDSYIINKQEYFYEKIKKKTPENIKFINSFYINKTNTKVNFYFGIQIEKNNPIISIYDWKKIKKNIDYIIPNSYGYSILWLQNIWIKSNKIGINWTIIQMKIYYPILKIDECLIEDEEYFDSIDKEKNKIMFKDHDIYSKYFKMKRFKVPIESIKHKLSLENLNPNIIMKNENDYVDEEINSTNLSESLSNQIQLKDHHIFAKFFKMKKYQIPIENIKHKMMLENLDPNIILKDENEYYQTNILSNKIFLNDLQNVKLNSSVDNVKKNQNINNTNTNSNNLKKPPSLSDILSSKRSFKKLNLNLW